MDPNSPVFSYMIIAIGIATPFIGMVRFWPKLRSQAARLRILGLLSIAGAMQIGIGVAMLTGIFPLR